MAEGGHYRCNICYHTCIANVPTPPDPPRTKILWRQTVLFNNLCGLWNVAFPYLFVAQLSLVSPPVFTSADQTVVAT